MNNHGAFSTMFVKDVILPFKLTTIETTLYRHLWKSKILKNVKFSYRPCCIMMCCPRIWFRKHSKQCAKAQTGVFYVIRSWIYRSSFLIVSYNSISVEQDWHYTRITKHYSSSKQPSQQPKYKKKKKVLFDSILWLLFYGLFGWRETKESSTIVVKALSSYGKIYATTQVYGLQRASFFFLLITHLLLYL